MTPEAPEGESPPGLFVYVVRRAVFVHPAEFVFCGLPHEEEGQDVTGEDGGALPVPGGIGTGVRGRP